MNERVEEVPFFWMESKEQLSLPIRTKRKVRPKKIEFDGWGSKPLIEFLESIGKDTTRELSEYDVTAIINEYVKENRLLHPERKKRIVCDERLHSLFGKKTVARNKIYDLLLAHFAENQDESEDEWLYSSEEKGGNVCKQQKTVSSDKKAIQQRKKILETPKSCFAAIISENIKLVYLKRSLVQELLKNPETFESKMLGSYVRIKSDPNDYFQKNSHQLLQVTGVRNACGIGDIGTEILLQVSNLVKDVKICMLSDDNFTEEECEDLRQRVKDGFIKRPMVVELEQRAQNLHKDIIKHWLVREIALLQKLIDRANEKGWRKELFEYMERKQLLETPSEQSRLLLQAPKVIADEIEPEPTTKDLSESEQQNNGGSQKSILGGASENSEVSTNHLEASQTLPTRNSGCAAAGGIQTEFHMSKQDDKTVENKSCQENMSIAILSSGENKSCQGNMSIAILSSGENKSCQEMTVKQVMITAPQVIELSDDEEAVDRGCQNQAVSDHLRSSMWHYVDPQGDIQGPFSMASLKRWNDFSYFDPGFKVWRTGQSQDEAVLLSDLLRTFPS